MTTQREQQLINNHSHIQASPLVPWVGGKRRLAQHILPMFPDHSCYVEPFCGAAALFFMKQQVKVEVLNDVNGDLIRLQAAFEAGQKAAEASQGGALKKI